jgi:hypothetical protein
MTSLRRVAIVLWAVVAGLWSAGSVAAQESYAENKARLDAMMPEQKEELRRRKLAFDELSDPEKNRLRDLHAAITSDSNADELMATLKSYSRWLANLDPAEKFELQKIADPDKRIARIKELIQQQEERRFRQYFEKLPDDDRKTIYQWLGEFVASHADEIREKLPPSSRQRVNDAADGDPQRRELFFAWQRSRKVPGMPVPGADDYAQLFSRFTEGTQKAIESAAANALSSEPADQRTPERQKLLEKERMEELERTARYSRFFLQVSLDELHKFYNAMKSDDPRRKSLLGKEGDEFRRELQRMYNAERFWGSGPGGPRFGPGWPPPPGSPPLRGDGRPGERPDGDDRGAKPPPGERPDDPSTAK